VRYSTDLIVLDLEATCPERDTNTIERSNIIDIGAVRLDRRTLEVTGVFSELVRPRDFPVYPHITGFTGITPEMVEECDTFDRVAERFVQWCGSRNKFALAVFGAYYDVPLLRKEFDAFGMDFRKHFVGTALDIRAIAMVWLAEKHDDTTGITVERTLEKMQIQLDLEFHRAVADARAEAAILQFYHFGRISV
jgi:DNA polymerase III epsilon subunit-like protein